MDWTTLFSMQKELDTYIEENHDLAKEDLFEKKYLALLVELGELANETRCFKFWSTNSKIDEDAVLEEYVDGIHFILSLGINKGLDENFKIERINGEQWSMTEQFILIYHLCTLFKMNPTKESYHILFTSYLQLGEMLGFTYEKIEQAYLDKNKVNFERQDEGY